MPLRLCSITRSRGKEKWKRQLVPDMTSPDSLRNDMERALGQLYAREAALVRMRYGLGSAQQEVQLGRPWRGQGRGVGDARRVGARA